MKGGVGFFNFQLLIVNCQFSLEADCIIDHETSNVKRRRCYMNIICVIRLICVIRVQKTSIIFKHELHRLNELDELWFSNIDDFIKEKRYQKRHFKISP